jgi:dihydroxy-acid dehydratase
MSVAKDPKAQANQSLQTGIRKGLTRYGDTEFSLFLRKAFIKAMGYSDSALAWGDAGGWYANDISNHFNS